MEISYQDLDKHFTEPKRLLLGQNGFSNHTRIPRKFKKKWAHILCGPRYGFLELNQKLWYIQHLTNNNYNRFLIKKMCERN